MQCRQWRFWFIVQCWMSLPEGYSVLSLPSFKEIPRSMCVCALSFAVIQSDSSLRTFQTYILVTCTLLCLITEEQTAAVFKLMNLVWQRAATVVSWARDASLLDAPFFSFLKLSRRSAATETWRKHRKPNTSCHHVVTTSLDAWMQN